MLKDLIYKIARHMRLLSRQKYRDIRQKRTPSYKAVEGSRYFDRRWYKCQYLNNAPQIDAIEHYTTVGYKKGFETAAMSHWNHYLKCNPDVKKEGVCPLVHYEQFGRKEKRSSFFGAPPEKRNRRDALAFLFKSQNPKVSIIVASYNYQDLIQKTLNSLMSQTYPFFEVIVVDDGSRDASVDVIMKYVQKHPNISLFQHENGCNKGLAATLQLGIRHARGKYIAFCESDDYWTSDHLAQKMQTLSRYFNPVIVANKVHPFGKMRTNIQNHLTLIDNLLVPGRNRIDFPQLNLYNPIATFSSVMIKRKELLKCDFNTPEAPWIDYWLYRQLLLKHDLIYMTQELTHWYLHQSFNSPQKEDKSQSRDLSFMASSNALIWNRLSSGTKETHLKPLLAIRNSKLFDAKWYQEKHMPPGNLHDPAAHYLAYGTDEKITTSARFNHAEYLFLNKDLKNKNILPLLHWELYGKHEKRSASFQSISAELYPPKYVCPNAKQPHALLVSHELSMTGAPMVLLAVGRVLINQGYAVTLLSMNGGPLADEFLKTNIPVIVAPGFFHRPATFKRIKEFAFCLCNTYVTTPFFKYVQNKIPSLLWIHEIIDGPEIIPAFVEELKDVKQAYTPNLFTTKPLKKIVSKVNVLPYPFEDVCPKPVYKKYTSDTPLKFAIVGSISHRKAQDIFTQAIYLLPQNLRKRATFEILGSISDPALLTRLKKQAPCVYFKKPLLSRKKMMQYMNSIDVLCCISRADPNPLVVSEAMMHGKTCIVSTKVGQKDIIQDKKNGFIVPVENAQALADVMASLIQDSTILNETNKASRETFLIHHTPQAFVKILKKIICR